MGTYVSAKVFLERVAAVHGTRYEFPYIHQEWKGISHSAVTLRCKVHGDSKVKAISVSWHAGGCSTCGHEHVAASLRRFTNESFVAAARKIHGKRYDYSKVIYRGIHHHVTLSCKLHGEFRSEAGNHLSGSGCYACGKIASGKMLAGKLQNNLKSSRLVGIRGHYFHVDSNPEETVLRALAARYKITQIRDQRRTPVIQYVIEGRVRHHRPDFAVPSRNLLIEVKSPFTLGLTRPWMSGFTAKNLLTSVRVKAIAAQTMGYRYKVMLVTGRGTRAKLLALPDNWESSYKTPSQLRRALDLDFGAQNG